MDKKTKQKLWVFAGSVVFFAGGVAALSMEPGTPRTALLTAAFAGLIAIALWQTVRKWQKPKK